MSITTTTYKSRPALAVTTPAMTALFLVLFIELWSNRYNRPAELLGVVVSLVCLLVFGADGFILPTMLLIVAILLVCRRKFEFPSKGAGKDA
mgnify:CR=1 FL=1